MTKRRRQVKKSRNNKSKKSRKPMKRNKIKNKNKNKKMKSKRMKKRSVFSLKGGMYNTEQIAELKKILTGYQYTEKEQIDILQTLNISSQNFPFTQLIYQITINGNDPNIDYSNLTPEEIEEGRDKLENTLEFYNNYNENYSGETDEERSTNSF